MRKTLLALAVLLGLCAPASADTLTPRIGLTLPTVGSANWGPKISTNFVILETSAAIQGLANTFTASNTFTAPSLHTSSITLTGASSFIVTGSSITGGYFTGDGSGLTRIPAAQINGQVSVSSGGTGVGTLASKGILFGNGTSAISATAAMANGGLVIGSGTGANPSTGTISASAALSISNGPGSISLGVDSSSVAVKSGGFVRNADIDSSSVTKQGQIIPVSAGGTAATSLTAHGVIIGEGTSAVSIMPAMANGGIVMGAGTGADPSTGTVSVSAALAITNGPGAITLAVDSSSVAVKSGGFVRNSEIDGSSVTKLGSTGLVPNSLIDGSSITKQGQIIPVTAGGTASTSLTAHGVLIGEGTSALAVMPAMANGGIIMGSGTGADPSTGTISVSAALGITNGSGSISLRVDSSSVVVKSGGLILNSEIDGSSITKLSAGLVPNVLIDASSITKQGNAFNAANQLVKLDGSGTPKLPAVDGSQLLNLPTGESATYSSSKTFTDAVAVGGINAGNGTLVVKSTSATTTNPIVDFKNNSGTSQFKVTQAGNATLASGTLSIGYHLVTQSKGDSSNAVAACSGSEVVLGGFCQWTDFLTESQTFATTSVTCSSSTGATAWAYCARLAP